MPCPSCCRQTPRQSQGELEYGSLVETGSLPVSAKSIPVGWRIPAAGGAEHEDLMGEERERCDERRN
jgi:hypothetical protein